MSSLWLTLLLLSVSLQGVPFPQNEANAMDVVLQFAIHRLGFQPQDIVIYAWSIGGFTGTCLPAHPYPVDTGTVLWLPRRGGWRLLERLEVDNAYMKGPNPISCSATSHVGSHVLPRH